MHAAKVSARLAATMHSSRKRRAPPDEVAETPDTASQRRPDRVVIDVGGTMFTTSVSTLTGASNYFKMLFAERWDQAASDEPPFIDRDPESFAPLLTFMRTGCVELPECESLARRVLLEALFLGIESLLCAVKAQAHRNLQPEGWEGDDAAAATAFDAEHGGLEGALRDRVLPARFHGRAPPPPPRKVVRMLPASHVVHIRRETDDDDQKTVLPAICLAQVENPRNINPDLPPCVLDAFVVHPDRFGMVLASEVFDDTTSVEILPRRADQLIPIPKGVVMGEYWKDSADHSKGTHTADVHFLRVTGPDGDGEMRVDGVDVRWNSLEEETELRCIRHYGNFKAISK